MTLGLFILFGGGTGVGLVCWRLGKALRRERLEHFGAVLTTVAGGGVGALLVLSLP